jgi:hypothetical protein
MLPGRECLPVVNNRFSKGHQGYLYELKVLAGKRDTDYGNTAQSLQQHIQARLPTRQTPTR